MRVKLTGKEIKKAYPVGDLGMTASEGLRTLLRWLGRSPVRTFVIYPAGVITFELALHSGHLRFVPWGTLPLAWGYLQYRLAGNFRQRRGRGGPGITVPPERIVTEGPYRYVRNPMYLGHLIFMLGLALTFWSWFALALFVVHAVWFHRRVLADEARLWTQFGTEYADYQARVKRWIPDIF